MRTLAAAVSVCLLAAVLSVASAAPGDELYARPGQLVTAQETLLNFYCMGRGSPTVAFDSGWGAGQLFTDKSSEYIPFDQPGFVVDAIREVTRRASGGRIRLPRRLELCRQKRTARSWRC